MPFIARRRATPLRPRHRRGLSTGWLLIWSPIFLAAILLAVEVGNVFLAKVQLINALEAAALAGVKQWSLDGSDVSSPRVFAREYARVNTVSGQPVILDANFVDPTPGNPNGNADCEGDIVLGAVIIPDNVDPDDCSQFIFDANEPPTAAGGNLVASYIIRVQTTDDTRNDVQAGEYPFSISAFTSNNPALEISSVVYNVATVPPEDEEPGLFDLRPPPPGADRRSGIQPIFQGTGVTLASSSPTLADDTTSQTYTLNFPSNVAGAFNANGTDQFEFGVDTDLVGPDPLPGDNRAADRGGDFDGATVTVFFSLNGQFVGTISCTLDFVDVNTSQCIVIDEPVGLGNFGVRTRHRMPVTPICSSLFGMPLPQFFVCGEAAAAVFGFDGEPQLIHIDQFICSGP